MKNTYEQFPKNKEFIGLSDEQVDLRKGKKKYFYGKDKWCKDCGKTHSIKEFYIKDKNTGRRSNKCRDCELKYRGVVEIGKSRFSNKIFEKGFRRCAVCKETKPLILFSKNKSQFGGYSNNCKDCNKKLHKEFVYKNRNELSDVYIKQILKQSGIEITDDNISIKRNELIYKNSDKYFIDGKKFKTIESIGTYISEKYNVPLTTVLKRISEGRTFEECKLSNFEFRSRGTTKGKIVVTDTVTGQVFEFKNSQDEKLSKMFSKSTITRCLKSGLPTKITALSKYKNSCKIERK